MNEKTGYIERSKVREILLGVAGEHFHITELLLAQIDALPIVTADDLRNPDPLSTLPSCEDWLRQKGPIEMGKPTRD